MLLLPCFNALWRRCSRVERRQCIRCWSCLLLLLIIHSRGRSVLWLRTFNMQRRTYLSFRLWLCANYLSRLRLRCLNPSIYCPWLYWCISFLIGKLLTLGIAFLLPSFRWGLSPSYNQMTVYGWSVSKVSVCENAAIKLRDHIEDFGWWLLNYSHKLFFSDKFTRSWFFGVELMNDRLGHRFLIGGIYFYLLSPLTRLILDRAVYSLLCISLM